MHLAPQSKGVAADLVAQGRLLCRTHEPALRRFVEAVPGLAGLRWNYDNTVHILSVHDVNAPAPNKRRVNAALAAAYGAPRVVQDGGADRYYVLPDGSEILFQWDRHCPKFAQVSVFREVSDR